MLQSAAADAGKMLQIVEKRTQSTDHPILLASKETQYLKFFVLRIVD
jgi:23S rRNA (cytosine1962-C5)-methyltransferase